MECQLYMILIDGVSVARDVRIGEAMIFVEALFNKFDKDKEMTISIQRMDREGDQE